MQRCERANEEHVMASSQSTKVGPNQADQMGPSQNLDEKLHHTETIWDTMECHRPPQPCDGELLCELKRDYETPNLNHDENFRCIPTFSDYETWTTSQLEGSDTLADLLNCHNGHELL